MRVKFFIPLVLLPTMAAACPPPVEPGPTPTTTTPPRECMDASIMHHSDVHDSVIVWYINDRGTGPYPVGSSTTSDPCIEKYAIWK